MQALQENPVVAINKILIMKLPHVFDLGLQRGDYCVR